MGPIIGYVRLYRRLLQNPIWTQLSAAVLKVAMYFLLKANYRPGQWYDGAQTVAIPPGCFVTSYASAAAACGLSMQQIRDAFAHLERTQFATYRRTPRWTLVTVVNWASYQAIADDENTAENTNRNRQGTPDKESKKKRTKTCASPGGNAQGCDPPSEGPPKATEAGARFPGEAGPRGTSQDLAAKQEAWFSQWWAAYWRHRARKAAREAFRKHTRTEARFQEIMAATDAQTQEMLAKEERYRPHGASWLNGRRWEDEATTPVQQPTTADDYPELKV